MGVNVSPRARDVDDIAHGAMVIIAARWVLVAAGLVLALWNPAGLVQLQVAIVLILAVAVGNFALHMQILTRGPLMKRVVYAASAADVAVISTLIMVAGDYPAAPYAFYLPAILAIGVTFRSTVAAIYAGAAIAIYGLIALAAIAPESGSTPSTGDSISLLTELLMLAGVAACGNVYWRLERRRRGEGAPAPSRMARRSVPPPAPDRAGAPAVSAS